MRLVQPLPRWRCGPGDSAIRPADNPTEPVLHVLPQPRIDRELRYLRALRRLLRLPLSHQRPVLGLPAAGRGVTAHLPRDGAGVTPDAAGDLTNTHILCTSPRDLLTLSVRQVTPRGLNQAERRPATGRPAPAHRHRRRPDYRRRGLVRGDPRSDQPPDLARHRTRRPRPAR